MDWNTIGNFPAGSWNMELRDQNGVGDLLATVYPTSNKRPYRAYVQGGKTQSFNTIEKAVRFATKEVLMEKY